MKIKEISIRNFRLLEKVELTIEDDIILIAGKNNTGKTSLFEVINMFIGEKNNFNFHDFSQATYPKFNCCYEIFEHIQTEGDEEKKNALEKELLVSMPTIQLIIQLEYDKISDSLNSVSNL